MILRRRFLACLMGTAAASELAPGFWRTAMAAAAPADELAKRLANDPRRPQYHLLPARNWMNDPNGPIWWKGKYHLFYQLNPHAAVWGDMHWGHAVSTDMVHWKHEPVALAPTPGGPDSEGCFSGSAVVFNGVPTIIYTGVQNASPDQVTIHDGTDKLREVQMLATAEDDNLLRWKKLPEPVVATPPAGIKVTGFRDPCPWKEDDGWYLAVGSGERDKGGCVLLYRSQDLRHWEYLHPLIWGKPNGKQAANPCDSGEMWECPDFFRLGDRYCLLYSTENQVIWTTGQYDRKAHVYTPDQAGLLDLGAYYAPKSFLAPDGRRILWGWIQERRPEAEYSAAGWAGMMSLPRVLSVAADGRLRFRVAEEANQLRNHAQILNLNADEDQNLRQLQSMRIEGCCGEILCVARRSTEPFALSLHGSSQNLTPWLKISYDPLQPDQVWIDDRPLPVNLSGDENLEFHFYVDGSVIEAFVNHQIACTRRFYYTGGKPQDLCMRWTGKTANLVSLSAWQLSPISTNRLTT